MYTTNRINHNEQAAENRAAIIQPGALGDCILTLPLVRFLKQYCGISKAVFIGHSSYIDYFVSRTQVDSTKSIDSIPFYKLFVPANEFSLDDNQNLLEVFTGINHIVSFMSPADSDFETNLINLIHCSHSAQITSLELKPPTDYTGHISSFYIEKFLAQNPQKTSTSPQKIELFHQKIDVKTSDFEAILKHIKGIQSFVLIAPGSGGAEKCWHLDNFIAIAQKLDSKGLKTIFILGYAEIERFSSDNLKLLNSVGIVLSDLSIPQILGLGKFCKFYLGNDSGISHLLAASGVRTFAIFGPTDPNIYAPLGENVHIIKLDKHLWQNSKTAANFVFEKISSNLQIF